MADRTSAESRGAPDGAERGRRLLAERIERAPGVVARVPERFAALEPLRERLPRQLVATGIGTSEGHARHLAEVAARFLGQPARFATTGSLAAGAPPGAERDWLVVFSQGLSRNARHALSHVEAWGAVILVTALPDPDTEEAGALDPERRAWLAELAARGVVRLPLGGDAERGSLLRTVGARAGYAAAWSVLRSLAALRLEAASSLSIPAEALAGAQRGAPEEAARAFPRDRPLAPFFAPDRPLVLVAAEGALELADQLALKLAEGMLRPRPLTVDVLAFAHGPLQGLAERDASFLYLEARAAGASSSGADPSAPDWRARFAETLDPARHDLRTLRARLPWPFAAVELEAIFDALVLRFLEETATDLVDWPGAAREDALYAVGPPLPVGTGGDSGRPGSGAARVGEGGALDWESRVWPEIEAAIGAGRRAAILPLGSIEQHGPHLPLGTDRWIADALARGLAARLDDALAIPAIPIGCASEHLDFAGTLHVEPATLEALLVDVLGSLARHGFERAFLFTAHGGNLDALHAMRERLIERARPLVLRVELDLRVGAMQSRAVEAARLSPLAAGPHAGEYETSVVAHLRPGSIRADRLATGRRVPPGEAQGLFYPSLRPNAPEGVLGDPSAARAERGPAYLAAWVDLLEAAYREAFGAARSGSTPPEKKRP